MVQPNRTMGSHQWAFYEETLHDLPDGKFSVGIGNYAVADSGMGREQIWQAIGGLIDQLTDGGADKVSLTKADGDVCYLYVRVRGKAVDIGARMDFRELGWEPLCERLDGNC